MGARALTPGAPRFVWKPYEYGELAIASGRWPFEEEDTTRKLAVTGGVAGVVRELELLQPANEIASNAAAAKPQPAKIPAIMRRVIRLERSERKP